MASKATFRLLGDSFSCFPDQLAVYVGQLGWSNVLFYFFLEPQNYSMYWNPKGEPIGSTSFLSSL